MKKYLTPAMVALVIAVLAIALALLVPVDNRQYIIVAYAAIAILAAWSVWGKDED